MKPLFASLMIMPWATFADPAPAKDHMDAKQQHQESSRALSEEQDELAADIQQIIIEQTHPKVIELFEEVEDAMDEASILLYDYETGGTTIAAQTDVIEKIFEAAKQKQQQQGGGQGQPSGAMLEMMERMLGREPGQKPGEKPGDQAGQGSGSDSTTENERVDGAADGKVEERTVPKGAGKAGQSMPSEFREALKSYNREADKLTR